mgnify:CR=1 FL=1
MNSPYELNLAPFDAHARLLQFVGAGKTVLDVGCASGYLAHHLAAQGCVVVGVEPDPDAAAQARAHCHEVVCSRVENLEAVYPRYGRFDVVLLGDVLEHLEDPASVLALLQKYLKAGGYLVISVPNVANYGVRLELLRGRFRYADCGVLDRHHLRFFTLDTLRELLESAGLEIEALEVTPGLFCWSPYRLTFGRLKGRFRFWRQWEYALARRFKRLFAFQFIVRAVPRQRMCAGGDHGP